MLVLFEVVELLGGVGGEGERCRGDEFVASVIIVKDITFEHTTFHIAVAATCLRGLHSTL